MNCYHLIAPTLPSEKKKYKELVKAFKDLPLKLNCDNLHMALVLCCLMCLPF